MQGKAPTSIITGVPGWETPEEQRALLKYARLVPINGTILEVGAEYGMSASIFCKGADPSVSIHSVDLMPLEKWAKYRENLGESGFTGRTHEVHLDSKSARREWGSAPIDLLFIDGDHSFTGATEDIQLWVPLVKPGGIVVFHDTACKTNRDPHYLHYEVTRAINNWYEDHSQDWRCIDMIDTTMVFQRDHS